MPRVRKGEVTWVEPKLVAEIAFGEWTRDGRLRASALPRPARRQGRARGAPRAAARGRDPQGQARAGLSNLDKVFWPDEGITKGDLIDYYRQVAPVLVPHLQDRPFTMRRYPDGIDGKVFFQKDAPSHMPEWIPTFHALVSPREGDGEAEVDFPVVNDELACSGWSTWAAST